MTTSIWAILGVEANADRDTIRRAYSARLKLTNPEDDPEGFQRLRSAYEAALGRKGRASTAGARARPVVPPPEPPASVPIEATDQSVPDDSVARPVRAAPRMARTRAAVGSDVDAAMRKLRRLLAEGAEPDALKATMAEIIGSSSMDDLTVFSAAEQRLAELIARNAPTSDPLIADAMAAFKWDWRAVDGRRPTIRAVLQRDEDVRHLKLLASPRHPDHQAYRALTQPWSPWRDYVEMQLHPGLPETVRRVLASIDHQHASLSLDLDAKAESWWRAYVAEPRAPWWSLYVIIGAALSGVVAGPFIWPAALWSSPAGFLGGLVVGVVAIALGLWGLARPRHWWKTRRQWSAEAWERLGWAPAATLVVLAATLLPHHPASTVFVGLLSLCVICWCAIVGEPDRRPGGAHWVARMLILLVPIIAWWGVLASASPQARSPALALALGAAIVASANGAGTLIDWYHYQLPSRWRLVALCGILALGCIASVVVWLGFRQPVSAPVAMALAALFFLAHRPPTAWLTAGRLRVRQIPSYITFLFLGTAAAEAPATLPLWGCAWLIANAAVGLALTVNPA